MLHRDLVMLGFEGSYDRVAAFARDWRQQQREADNQASRGTYIPLIFAPGEAFQFDWSEDWARVGSRQMKLQVAHFKLCHSRAFMLRAYPLLTHEMLFDAHNHCLRALGGIPRRGIYDNMKTAVYKVGRGKQRQVNVRFRAMVSHFMFESDFCNPAAGWEKGQVEKNVRDARFRIWHDAPAFRDLAALNIWLEQRCKALWHEIRHLEQTNRTIAEVYADRLVMVARTEVIAEHQRIFSRDHSSPGKTSYDWRHYLAVVQRKPGALQWGTVCHLAQELSNFTGCNAEAAWRGSGDGRYPGPGAATRRAPR